MYTSRNCVTNYIHKFNVIVLGRDLFVKWVLIHSLNNLAQLTKCASESVCEILQSDCSTAVCSAVDFLSHNTSRNSWFTFIAISGKRCSRLVVQTLVLKPGEMMCLRLVVQLVVTICLQMVVQSLVSNACDWTSQRLAACWSFLEEVPAGFIIARPSAESLARRQNAVVSTYANDIVLQSPTSNTNCCAPADLYRSSSILRLFLASVPAGPFAPADLSSSAEHDVVTDYIIIDGPLRCSSWFSFDVPVGPSSSSSACSWFISFQLIHYAPASSTWPPPDF
ncbi:plant intracell Ras-group-related LRR protein 6 [Dorcoceras hygrometricum]|uniref:Plant intracell Ras-group-related LRR protein 6 n=1 Tax=Dorcoceras hygrometricum TaxID=472368 RepID=A0A2Z7BCS0_9LAMI|nr:plant intracell Ras-group-related LRR protein 6 [Dorcoceras hygrometricum]